MAAIVTYQADGSASVWVGISQALADALSTAINVSDQAGHALTLEQLPNNGGYLVNGCPLNVWFGNGWLPGQQEALQQLGITQCLPQTNVSDSNGSTTQPTSTTFRCYYEDGTITVADTCSETNDNGSPLHSSELSIIQDVNASTPTPWWLLLVLAALAMSSKKKH